LNTMFQGFFYKAILSFLKQKILRNTAEDLIKIL
jgi:hypothetical protein